ncbi:membrane protein [Streptomyces inusitatus]|uniref:Membrane protein n=1 Tax=Streptomyces inusitatus TaxID=68221 RepID=A0A918QJP6_9ACTN|nr:membrane protein [Streptomyces inusitatus]
MSTDPQNTGPRSGDDARDGEPERAAPAAGESRPESNPEPKPEPKPEAETRPMPGGPRAQMTGRQRLIAGLWPPRVTRAQLTVAALLFVLGLGLAIQVRSTSDNSAFRGARQEDLVRILGELDSRTERLEHEKQRLEEQRTELENSSDQAEEARRQTEQKEQQLGILAGSVAAQGPGITLTITDGSGAVEADMLLDAIQELRAAGAEAIQVNDVRVVADTYFTGTGGDIEVDGNRIGAPYIFKVIGKPQDLEPALNIPGGVVQTLEKEQATATVVRSEKIVVDALRPVKRPGYARSSAS